MVPVNQNPFISTILNYKTKNLNIKFSRAMHQLIVELLYPKNKSFLRILNFNKIWLSSCGLIVSEGPSWPAIVSSFAGAARTKLTDRMTKNNACKNKLRKCKWSQSKLRKKIHFIGGKFVRKYVCGFFFLKIGIIVLCILTFHWKETLFLITACLEARSEIRTTVKITNIVINLTQRRFS